LFQRLLQTNGFVFTFHPFPCPLVAVVAAPVVAAAAVPVAAVTLAALAAGIPVVVEAPVGNQAVAAVYLEVVVEYQVVAVLVVLHPLHPDNPVLG
jgi:hypothetical protein